MNPMKTALPFTAISLPIHCQFSGRALPFYCQSEKNDGKTEDYQVAATPKHCQTYFTVKKQCFALFCSLLRRVWSFSEVGTTEDHLSGHFSAGKWQLPPANGRPPKGLNVKRVPCLLLLALSLLTSPAQAGEWSDSGSFDDGEAKAMRAALSDTPTPSSGNQRSSVALSSKWVSLDAFERSKPGKARPREASFRLPSGAQIEQLYALIAFAEAPGLGYNAIHHSAKIRTPKKPSQMTLDEIYDWIEATPRQHHAIGRYQIIPSTLADLQGRLGLPGTTRFGKVTQDRMASRLIADAKYRKFQSGQLSLSGFMDNLANIWAGLPVASGESAYKDIAGNRATITRAFFSKQMKQIFGQSRAKAKTRTPGTATKPKKSAWTSLGQ